jgi:hypothetical protein
MPWRLRRIANECVLSAANRCDEWGQNPGKGNDPCLTSSIRRFESHALMVRDLAVSQ